MDLRIFINVSQWLWPLMHLCLLLVALTRFRASYWGRLLAVSAGLSLVASIYFRCSSLLFRAYGMPGWMSELNGIAATLSQLAAVLVVIALASAPFSWPKAILSPPVLAGPPGRPRSAWLLALLLPVTANIYWVFWLHRTVKEIRSLAPDALPFTPGRAVGCLFIPVFNLYWFFRVWFALTKTIDRLNERFAESEAEPENHSTYAGLMTCLLLTLGLVFNAMGSLDWHFLLLGEPLFIFALAYTQRYLNRIWLEATWLQDDSNTH